ncbi:HK97 family phage prohead protease [Hamadaea flava]|uniref:HK97 family phage prohead protease n=1 Tax=Hamadaea flava TaxID=1742688 RepID=A0ABV8LXP8_9ACTN|nr:HK97 family phage prohead protease [Hamadaea flava]MCP2327601.1 HK97 family phage prohead protease [Hamadaea flava]
MRATSSTVRRVTGQCTRSYQFETAATGDGRTLEGYAAVFNSPTLIRDAQGDFYETILPGAFTRSLAQRTPVLQWDHGKDPRIGQVPIGKIEEIREDARGLFVRARLFAHPDVDRVREAIAEGAVTGMSFRFTVPDGGDDWTHSDGFERRAVRDATAYELGPVVFPAYDTTSVSVRGALSTMPEARRMDRKIEAYVAVWGEVRSGEPDGGALWTIKDADTFRDWLKRGPHRVPILVNHGRDYADDRASSVLSKPCGWWHQFTVDETGLRATGYLDDTPLGVQVAERIRSGELSSCSYRGGIRDCAPAGVRDGEERVRLRAVDVSEAGPTSNPADPRAVILTLGGRPVRGRAATVRAAFTEPELRAVLRALGTTLDKERRHVQADRDRRRFSAEDGAARAERIALVLRRKRHDANLQFQYARGALAQSGDFRRALDLQREADAVERDLMEQLYYDREAFAMLAERLGIPPKANIIGEARKQWSTRR